MRKIALLFILLIISIAFVSGTTETLQSIPDFNITAYKTAPLPVCDISVTSSISDAFGYTYSQGHIDNTVFDITAITSTNSSITGAVSVKMSTNRKKPNLKVKVTLKPFRSVNGQKDAKYKIMYYTSTLQCTFNNASYRYSATLSSDVYNSGDEITVSSDTVIELEGNIKSSPDLPQTSGSQLPGVLENQLLIPECRFNLIGLSLSNFTSGVEYTAYVNIEIYAK